MGGTAEELLRHAPTRMKMGRPAEAVTALRKCRVPSVLSLKAQDSSAAERGADLTVRGKTGLLPWMQRVPHTTNVQTATEKASSIDIAIAQSSCTSTRPRICTVLQTGQVGFGIPGTQGA